MKASKKRESSSLTKNKAKIKELEESISKLSKETENYEHQLSLIKEKLNKQKEKEICANEDYKKFLNEHLDGKTPYAFVQANLTNAKKGLEEKTESNNKTNKTSTLSIIVTIVLIAIYAPMFYAFETSTFLCADDVTEVDYDMIDDGVRDCPGGEDEQTSSIWSSDDDTRAEEWEESVGDKSMLLGIGLGTTFGIIGYRLRNVGQRDVSTVLENFEADFYNKHQNNIELAKKLDTKCKGIEKDIVKYDTQINKLKSKKENLMGQEKELENTLLTIEKVSIKLEKVTTDVEVLIEKIDQHWDSIRDLVPYGKILL